MPSLFAEIVNSLDIGLPLVLLHFGVALLLLGLGVLCYTVLTPFHERDQIRRGNVAAGIAAAGAVLALAIPLAATLATSAAVIDIIVWGLIALILQLLAFAAANLLFPHLRAMLEGGNVAAALSLVGIQLAVALLIAGAMAG